MKRRIATDLLEQWGIWVHQKTGVPRYVSPMLVVMRNNVPSTHAPDAQITDEDAEEIAAILARLHRDDAPSASHRGRDISEALHLYYADKLTQHQVAERLRRNRQQVRDMLTAGEWYVQAALDLVDAMAASVIMRSENHSAGLQCQLSKRNLS